MGCDLIVNKSYKVLTSKNGRTNHHNIQNVVCGCISITLINFNF